MCSIVGNSSGSLAGSASSSIGAGMPVAAGGSPSILAGQRPRLRRPGLIGQQATILGARPPAYSSGGGSSGGRGPGTTDPNIQPY